MEKLVKQLRHDYPHFTFEVGEILCWSPAGDKIFYQDVESDNAISGLLHELAHARLNHQQFTSDLDLLKKEVDAWQEALQLATIYGLKLSAEHAEDCLDTYRDWLHKRSTCPSCHANGLQQDPSTYICFNCDHTWRVSNSRVARPYRLSQTGKRKKTKV